jgi:hypothetical protein
VLSLNVMLEWPARLNVRRIRSSLHIASRQHISNRVKGPAHFKQGLRWTIKPMWHTRAAASDRKPTETCSWHASNRLVARSNKLGSADRLATFGGCNEATSGVLCCYRVQCVCVRRCHDGNAIREMSCAVRIVASHGQAGGGRQHCA